MYNLYTLKKQPSIYIIGQIKVPLDTFGGKQQGIDELLVRVHGSSLVNPCRLVTTPFCRNEVALTPADNPQEAESLLQKED